MNLTIPKEPEDPRHRYAGFESVPLRITVRIGAARCTLRRLAELREGQVIELDRPIGATFDLLAGAILLGRVEPMASDRGISLKLISAGEDDDESPR